MTEGVEDQEVSYFIYQPSILLTARSNLLVPEERKKNFKFFLSGKGVFPIDCSFLQTSGKSMKKRLEWYDPSVTPE